MKLSCLLAALMALASAASAAVPSALRLGPQGASPALRERPDPAGTPTRVGVGVYLLDLYKLDDVAQTFSADLILSLIWRDPRLAAGMPSAGKQQLSYPIGEVWYPEPMLVNARSVDAEGPQMVLVGADGVCRYSQRFKGVYSFKSDLTDFPLDQQTLAVQVVFPPRVGEVVLAEDRELNGIWEDVSIPNWRLLEASARSYDRYLPQVRGTVQVYEFTQQVQRHRVYYIWKLIVPLIIVVLMSWSVFWISPKMGLQLGLGATSVLTLIAYRFATATLLPPIGYLTRLDLFLTGSSVLVLVALIEALVTVGLADRDRVEAALRIDRVCRVLVPIVFAGILVWSFWL